MSKYNNTKDVLRIGDVVRVKKSFCLDYSITNSNMKKAIIENLSGSQAELRILDHKYKHLISNKYIVPTKVLELFVE